MRHLFADGGYAGDKLHDALAELGRWTIEIIKRSDTAKGFEVLPRRWVVERTFACEASDEHGDMGDVDPCDGAGDGRLEIPGKTAAATEQLWAPFRALSGADQREDGTATEKGSYEGPYGTQNYIDWKHIDPVTGEGMPNEPAWSTLPMLWDVSRYCLPADGVIPIVAKGWQYDPTNADAGFHIPWSWAVCAKVFDFPLGYSPTADNDVTTDTVLWPEWLTITIADNLITSAPSALTKRICRPVMLSGNHGTWRVRCEARCDNGGEAVLIARGHDALAGDAYVQSARAGAGWTPLECVFTTKPHNVRRLPNAAKMVIVLRHNGIGTAAFRNVTVTRL